MATKSLSLWSISYLIFFGLFLLFGVLHMWYRNPLIGSFYVTLAFSFYPGFGKPVLTYFQVTVPRGFKYLIALLVLWATIVVGDFTILFKG